MKPHCYSREVYGQKAMQQIHKRVVVCRNKGVRRRDRVVPALMQVREPASRTAMQDIPVDVVL